MWIQEWPDEEKLIPSVAIGAKAIVVVGTEMPYVASLLAPSTLFMHVLINFYA
jgi:hypothetical protein